MPTLDNYYNRFDSSKEFESHMFRAGYVLQAAELNEIQANSSFKLKGIADALFSDGAVVRDAKVNINQLTGVTLCESGAIYVLGAVRGVIPATITIPIDRTVHIGVYVQESAITEVDDASLRDPASLTRNYQEPGAGRHKIHLRWGYDNDGTSGAFYRCYDADNGVLRVTEPPPNIDAITQSIARYDRDSAGGNYVISGLKVEAMADTSDGVQQYVLHEGRARVNGFAVELQSARRLKYNAIPDTTQIVAEPKTSSNVSTFRFNSDFSPIASVSAVQITSETTDSIVHGGFIGAQDSLPHTSVLSLVEVKQGGTTYVAGTDYNLTAGKVDWTPGGAEPATGSTYTVKYHFIQTVAPTALDQTGFTVNGALVGTLVLATYTYKMPRVDRLALDKDGQPIWIKGVASDNNPRYPVTPDGYLGLAAVTQTWTASRSIKIDAPQMTPMSELSAVQSKLDFLIERVLEDRLKLDINSREASIKRGMFVDPFTADTMRDQGVAQTAAIVRGELMLPITPTVYQMPSDITAPQLLTYTHATAMEQLLKTSSIKVNPYLSFAPIPAVVDIVPAVDRWTNTDTTWTSPATNRVVTGSGDLSATTTSLNSIEVGSTTTAVETLRPISITVSASGFVPGEHLLIIDFDGTDLTTTAIAA